MQITIRFDDDPGQIIPWHQFCADNEDAIEAGELDAGAIRRRLVAGETVTLGGGAAPLVTLTRVAS